MATWQQKKKFHSYQRIYKAFIDDPEKPPSERRLVKRTWAELKREIPESTLSRNLRELIKDGYVKATSFVDTKGRLQRLYEWNSENAPPVFSFKDHDKLKFAVRRYKDGTAEVGWGYWVTPRQGMKKYFRFVKKEKI